MSGYFNRPWRWSDIRAHASWVVQLHSGDDPLVPVAEARHVAQQLRLAALQLPSHVQSHGALAPPPPWGHEDEADTAPPDFDYGTFSYLEFRHRNHFMSEELEEVVRIVSQKAGSTP